MHYTFKSRALHLGFRPACLKKDNIRPSVTVLRGFYSAVRALNPNET